MVTIPNDAGLEHGRPRLLDAGGDEEWPEGRVDDASTGPRPPQRDVVRRDGLAHHPGCIRTKSSCKFFCAQSLNGGCFVVWPVDKDGLAVVEGDDDVHEVVVRIRDRF